MHVLFTWNILSPAHQMTSLFLLIKPQLKCQVLPLPLLFYLVPPSYSGLVYFLLAPIIVCDYLAFLVYSLPQLDCQLQLLAHFVTSISSSALHPVGAHLNFVEWKNE